RHLQFVDRMGETFRWKGENVSTTEVENIIDGSGMVEEAIVYGVEIPKTNGKAGMVTLVPQSNGSAFDINKLFGYLQENLPAYAVPVVVRVTNAIEKTGTFKYRKVDIQKLGDSVEPPADDVYAWLPGASCYTFLTPELGSGSDSGDVRFCALYLLSLPGPSLHAWEVASSGIACKLPLQSHPCALISGHPWPAKVFGSN